MNPKQKQNLAEIQEMAQRFHRSLVDEFGEANFIQGGDLFLGRYYGESDRIYFGINPGATNRDEDPFKTGLETREGFNPPFRHEGSDIGNWNKWKGFLSKHRGLDEWFNNKVTSTFLCPWRTKNGEVFEKLNRATKDKLYQYSSQLVCKMIDHHNPKVLVLAGLKAVHLFNELMLRAGKRAWDFKEVNATGKSKKYAKHWFGEKGIAVLQIPHFSWPISNKALDSLAEWLRTELKPFGL